MICRPVAATGQLVGHCIGGKVSSRLHLQWPGTPGTPAATTALGAKSVASCTYSGQEHQKQQQLHVHPGQRNWAACTRSQLQETISIRLRVEKETQEQPEVYPRCPRWINQEAKAYTQAYAPAAPTKGCRLKHHKHHGISKNNISWNCLNVTEYLFWNIVLFQILVDICK